MVCRNLHESLVVFVNFEDVQIIFGIDELLNSAVVGRDCNYAGQVLEARLAVHPHLLFSENKYQIWKPCLSHFFGPKLHFFGTSFSYVDKNSVFSPFPNRRERDQSWRRRETCLERGSAISLLLVLEAKIGIRFFCRSFFSMKWMKLIVKDLQKQMHSFWNLYYK